MQSIISCIRYKTPAFFQLPQISTGCTEHTTNYLGIAMMALACTPCKEDNYYVRYFIKQDSDQWHQYVQTTVRSDDSRTAMGQRLKAPAAKHNSAEQGASLLLRASASTIRTNRRPAPNPSNSKRRCQAPAETRTPNKQGNWQLPTRPDRTAVTSLLPTRREPVTNLKSAKPAN
jgi:hypothetical protein